MTSDESRPGTPKPTVADTPTIARTAQVSQWVGIICGAFFVVLLISLALLDANADALRGPLARLASAHLGRPVHIDGRLQLHLLSWQPRIVINQLRIANPQWLSTPADMARIGRLQASVSIPALFKGEVLLPYLGVDDSDINVVRDAKQRMNWSFTPAAPAKPSARPARFPILGSLHLGPGRLTVQDEVRKLEFTGT